MKVSLLNIFGFFLVGLSASCSKMGNMNPTSTSTLNLINAINFSNSAVTDFTPLATKAGTQSPLIYYNTANQIGYGGFYESGSYLGLTSLTISQIDDTTKSLWTGQFSLDAGSIHSLFFLGDTSAVDTLFTTDKIPFYPDTDSVAGVRFVNLAEGAAPSLITNQADSTHTPLVNAVPYKGVTPFAQLSANNNALNTGYTLEIREAANDSILTTISLFYTGCTTCGVGLFPGKNVTICLIGQWGANAQVPLSAILYPNY